MGNSAGKAEELKQGDAKRKVSTTYQLQRLLNVVIALRDAKMLNDEEKKILSKVYNDIKNREIGGELEL